MVYDIIPNVVIYRFYENCSDVLFGSHDIYFVLVIVENKFLDFEFFWYFGYICAISVSGFGFFVLWISISKFLDIFVQFYDVR